MREQYQDIRDLTDRKPDWYDDNGVPRYCEFSPRVVPNIYADRVALLRIACQDCGQQFDVSICVDSFGWGANVKPRNWHYGDPPRHDCRGGGETMNCIDIAVLQSWRRNHDLSSRLKGDEWMRCQDEEGLIDQEE